MGLRLRWRARVLPGVHLNISFSGLSISLGGSPLTLNVPLLKRQRASQAALVTISAPGTGLSFVSPMPELSDNALQPLQLRNIDRAAETEALRLPGPIWNSGAVLKLFKEDRNGVENSSCDRDTRKSQGKA